MLYIFVILVKLSIDWYNDRPKCRFSIKSYFFGVSWQFDPSRRKSNYCQIDRIVVLLVS
jgi:hypothetical protein